MRDVGYKFDQLQWVASAYALTYGAILLLGVRVGDLYRHRTIFLFGVIWFSIWSVVNDFVKTPVVMSIGRALLVLLVVFVIIQFKISYPIIPLHVWRSRCIVASCALATSIMATLNAHFFFTSLVFQNILGYTPLKTSLCFILHGVGVGLTIGIISKLVVQRVPSKSSLLWMNSVADAADEDQGIVGAVYNVCLQVGVPVGIPPVGIAIANIIADKYNKGTAAGLGPMTRYRGVFYSFAAMASVGLVLTLFLNPNQDVVVQASEDNGDFESIASQGKEEVSTIG
ncbi:hypothetical protein BGZ81_010616 [Podila clonocystis]|nr:hypothetical protein BGZ81_010616 [Podila clonocystis]